MKGNLVFINDTHVGSTTGLFPLNGVHLKDGNLLSPNPLQVESGKHWDEFWKRRKKERRPIALFLGGDMIEGKHHQMTQMWANPQAHIETCLDLLRMPANMAQYIFAVSGTPVHAGDEGCADDAVAKQIGATEVYGRRCNYHIRVSVFGVRVDLAHQGPSRGRREWNRENQLRLYTKSVLMHNVASGRATPDVVVRCHRHVELGTLVHYENRQAWGFLSPSWQWRTEYAHVVSGEDSTATVGGLVVYVEDGRVVDYVFDCFEVEDVPVEKFGD